MRRRREGNSATSNCSLSALLSGADTLCAQPRLRHPQQKHQEFSLGSIITPPKKAREFPKAAAAAALNCLANVSLLSVAAEPKLLMGLLTEDFHKVPLAKKFRTAGAVSLAAGASLLLPPGKARVCNSLGVVKEPFMTLVTEQTGQL